MRPIHLWRALTAVLVAASAASLPARADIAVIGGGLIGLVSYGVVVWAMSATDMAKVSGLRETSILFAAILGALFLKEPFTLRRAACAVVISAGAILLAS